MERVTLCRGVAYSADVFYTPPQDIYPSRRPRSIAHTNSIKTYVATKSLFPKLKYRVQVSVHLRAYKTTQNIECGELDLGPPRSVGDRCTVAGRAAPADHGIPVDSPTSKPGPAGYSRVQRGWGLFGEERSQENHHTFEYGT